MNIKLIVRDSNHLTRNFAFTVEKLLDVKYALCGIYCELQYIN